MKVLRLTLKRKWFDMILSGEKIEEYRDLKDYWHKRLTEFGGKWRVFKKFDAIKFTNGYRQNSDNFTIKLKEIKLSNGKPEWGAIENKIYFVFELGDVSMIETFPITSKKHNVNNPYIIPELENEND